MYNIIYNDITDVIYDIYIYININIYVYIYIYINNIVYTSYDI